MKEKAFAFVVQSTVDNSPPVLKTMLAVVAVTVLLVFTPFAQNSYNQNHVHQHQKVIKETLRPVFRRSCCRRWSRKPPLSQHNKTGARESRVESRVVKSCFGFTMKDRAASHTLTHSCPPAATLTSTIAPTHANTHASTHTRANSRQ